jgi:ribosomal-protein-alanine N-acetyltransferase
MRPDLKSILGEITAFTITTPNLEQSLAFYKQLGYAELHRANWPFPWIQISDGVVLIMLRQDPQPYIALTYYVKNIDKVVAALEQKDVVFAGKAKPGDAVKRYLFHSPDGLNISLVNLMDGFKQPKGPGMLAMPPEDYFKPEQYVNKTCGLFGEFAHPVADLEASLVFWNLLGFEAISKYDAPYPWAIVTDGLSIVGLHQTNTFQYPAITYFAVDMQAKIAGLKKAGLNNFTDKDAGNTVLTAPEQQHIFLFSMGGGSDAKPKIDDLELTILETERLWLKALTPEVMAHIFTSFPEEEVMRFLGTTEEELAIEKANYFKGMTTYRISFKSFLMQEKATGNIVGRCGFHNWYSMHSRSEMGYRLLRDADKRKGFTSEALKAIIPYGFNEMGLNRIEACVAPDNTPSLRLMEKFGFRKEGVLREHFFANNQLGDSVIFGLLKNEFELS